MSNKKAKGPRAKTRDLFKRKRRVSVNNLLADFKVGQRVVVKINSAFHSGLPNKRFQGKSGEIIGRRGHSYIVTASQGNSKKSIIVSPAHLKALEGAIK